MKHLVSVRPCAPKGIEPVERLGVCFDKLSIYALEGTNG